jgi:HK97 gp10 family phage protein
MFKLTGLADLSRKATDALKKAFKGAFEEPQLTLSVGVFSAATREGSKTTVAQYAAYNEFGTTKIPPRPFLRPTMEERQEEWTEAIKGSVSSSLKSGQFNNRSILELIGEGAVKDVKARIMSNVPPPNAPSTVARKKAKGIEPIRTLVETGLMHASVEYKIEEGSPS